MAKRPTATKPAGSLKAPRKPLAEADGPPAVETGPALRGSKPGAKSGGKFRRIATTSYVAGAGKGRHLVIVESPSKAKTINKYLGKDYLVLASVGHVRDLPEKNPKGVKNPVPGVDLEHDFKPTYQVSEGKERVISDLKRAAKESLASGKDVWFATDLDREGEAIAWHLSQELGISAKSAKRVVFPAITKAEIEKAFHNPHPIDEDRVNAQQARRILDRIVGYQVSPLLWKKVARGLSAGRVQSVAVRVVVEREREIRAFIPEEYWEVEGVFTPELAKAPGHAAAWAKMLASRDEKNNPPTVKAQNAWLASHGAIKAQLVEVGGEKFEILAGVPAVNAKPIDLTQRVTKVAQLAGLTNIKAAAKEDPKGKGPARYLRTVLGEVSGNAKYAISAIETKRVSSRPGAPFITSTLQQAGATRLGFAALRTMRTAQQLYEGVEIPGEGPVGLITYMRTDSTHLSKEALEMARGYISKTYGEKYLPEKPNFFSSSNKDAQEAHEAIRPTSTDLPPSRVRNALNEDQFRLYTVIWERFISCQMVPALWDSTSVFIKGGMGGMGGTGGTASTDAKSLCTFKATGRVLVFDGFYKCSGVPTASDEQTLPTLKEQQPVAPIALHPEQKFTAPPSRFSEASLIKILEQEGIGRPSTYASIISVIQDRKYVEKENNRFFATDLGEVVTDKLVEAFPTIIDVGYTREMEAQLDKVEDEHLDWIDMLRRFYGPFKKSLDKADETLKHAKAETVPAPAEYKCPTCGSSLVYRFGKNGRFLSCSTYPACNYASPCDREGVPRPAAEAINVACIKCGSAMTKRVGRFGVFLGCSKYGDKSAPCDGLLNVDKKGKVVAPSVPALLTELPCPTCKSPMNLRNGLRGPWLGCSRFPKCRGRGKWTDLTDDQRKAMELALKNHEGKNPVKMVKTMDGKPLTDDHGKALITAPTVEAMANEGKTGEGGGTLEAIAEEMGV